MKSELFEIKGIPTLFVDHMQDSRYEYHVKSAVKHVVQYLSSDKVKISRNVMLGSPMFIEYFFGLSVRLLFVLSKEGTSFSLELCTGKLYVKPKNVSIKRSICTLDTTNHGEDVDLFGTDAVITGNTATLTNEDGVRVEVELSSIDSSPRSISHIDTWQVRNDRVAKGLNLDTVFDTSVFNTIMELDDVDSYIEMYGTKVLERIVDQGYENAMYFDSDYYKYVGILTVQCTSSSCFVYDSSLDK
jgi:hypothetical protein